MKLRKITNYEIATGKIMGPLLLAIFLALIIGICLYFMAWELLMFIGLLCIIIALGVVWFEGLPRLWNLFVDMVEKRK